MYTSSCGICNGADNTRLKIALSDKLKNKVLKRIYEQFDIKNDIDPDLFSFTNEQLDKAVEEGFGERQWGDPNYEFLQELKYNNAVFAAFKTHRQQNDLAALLLDDEGKQRPFSDFQKAAEPIIGSYNSTWLKTEHETAIKSARTAARFKEFEKDQDLYPNLKWLRSRAVNPRDSHKPYYNNVRSLHDIWWKTHYPGCVYGCQCDVKNTDEPVTHHGDTTVNFLAKEMTQASPGLDQNPAMTGSIFTDRHPYIKECYPGAYKAVINFLKSKMEKDGSTS